ncbi:DUF6584 family protein [Streptomyces griseoluteus]
MPLRDTLARVDEDLAAGRVPVARQRLRGLVSSFPCDPAPRRRLAEVYRLYGEPAQAGRYHADAKGSLAAAGCLVLAIAFLAIWVIGVVALLR